MSRRYRTTGPFLPFPEAQSRVRASRIRTYVRFCRWRRPVGIPAAPHIVYRNCGWAGWGDFLGTGRARRTSRVRMLPYWEAQIVAREAGIRSAQQFFAWDRPPGMPSAPWLAYAKSGWEGWAKFLGTNWLPYAQASDLARKAGVRGCREYLAWDRPDGVPSNPELVYRRAGWVSWGEFLGTGRNKGWLKKDFVPYAEARKRTRAAGICSSRAYLLWLRPEGLPARPDLAYAKSGWKGWGAFLGKIRRSREAVCRVRV